MLDVDNISFYYEKGRMILNRIRFHVRKGETVAILGSSGSGKSTLLGIIAGLTQPTEGRILLEGKDITSLACEKRDIGMVFQDYALFPHLNVEKNVGFALKSYKDPIVGEMLNLVKMSDYRKRYPYELSGGEKQRIAIARSLAASPRLLLLDEPFSNLDSHLKTEVRKDIREILAKARTTTILVTHDIEDANELADKIIHISDGKVEKTVEK